MNKKDVCAQFQCARDASDSAGKPETSGKTRDPVEIHNTCC
jgi:hypothetical protein